MRIARRLLVLGSALAIAVACLVPGTMVEDRAARGRLGGPRPVRPSVDPVLEPLEQRFHGIDPASLILYTPPGFRQSIDVNH